MRPEESTKVMPGGRPAPADSRPTDLWHYHTQLAVDDLSSLYRKLTTEKYTLVSKGIIDIPAAGPGFHRALLLRDPDGHAVLLTQR